MASRVPLTSHHFQEVKRETDAKTKAKADCNAIYQRGAWTQDSPEEEKEKTIVVGCVCGTGKIHPCCKGVR